MFLALAGEAGAKLWAFKGDSVQAGPRRLLAQSHSGRIRSVVAQRSLEVQEKGCASALGVRLLPVFSMAFAQIHRNLM